MRDISNIFLSGIFIVVIGLFEKILLYLKLDTNTNELKYLILSTPNFIWNISNITIGIGILLIIISFMIYFKNRKK